MDRTRPLIQTSHLIKRYGDKIAVNDVSFNVFAGEIFAFLGPNGAGKTTTIKMIVGLLQPTGGTVKVDGFDVQAQAVRAKAASGYVPDEPNLYAKLSARELLRFVGDLYDQDRQQTNRRIEELLRLFELMEVGDDLLDSYSHGMQQKISLAAALMHDPKVLVLDEPTVGLDPKSARLIKDMLRQMAERGAAVFLSTHILEIAERMCDRIGIINKGQLIAVGTMEQLRSLGQVKQAEQLIRAVLDLLALQAIQIADKPQQLLAGELGVQVGLVWHEAAGSLGRQRLLLHIVPMHLHQARSRLQEAHDHLDGGRLPGAVGPEKAKDFSSIDFKGDVIYCDFVAKALDEIFCFNQG